eukprot:tig00000142_g8643.t1
MDAKLVSVEFKEYASRQLRPALGPGPSPKASGVTKQSIIKWESPPGELENLRRVFETIDKDQDGKISVPELHAQFVKLKHAVKRSEVQDMLWQVDEDCDAMLSWDEFQRMFYRSRKDKSGLEPKDLYILAEFMMNDSDGSGFVSVDEYFQAEFMRFGKKVYENPEASELFNAQDIDKDRQLSFTEFCRLKKRALEPAKVDLGNSPRKGAEASKGSSFGAGRSSLGGGSPLASSRSPRGGGGRIGYR